MEKEGEGIREKEKKMSLEDFKSEIEELKKREKGGEKRTVHFIESGNWPEINVEELTEEDKKMWERFKNWEEGKGSVPIEDFRSYRSSVGSSGNVSRACFSAFLANRFTILDYKDKFEK